MVAVDLPDDEVRALVFLLESDIAGPVNLCAPNPVTNREFTGRWLGAAPPRRLRRPPLRPPNAVGTGPG